MVSSQNSQVLAKRSSETALMPPPPAPKRIKRPAKVLEDDEYVDRLSDIVKKQFFPDMVRREALIEYVDALRSKNRAWISEAEEKLEEVMAKVEPDMSLGAFQANYTSEDNEAVYQIMDKANEQRFQKRAWMYDNNMLPSKQRLAQQKVLEGKATKTIEFQPLNSRTATSQEIALRPSQDLDDRPAAPTTAKHTAYNSLMFIPEGVEEFTKSRTQLAEEASNAPQKAILYQNTRLPTITATSTATRPSDPPSPTLTAVRAAISGNPRPTDSEAGVESEEMVNGYAFVTELDPDVETRAGLLETYGARLGDGGHNPFHIKEAERREKLHLKMVDKIQAGKRDGNNGDGKGLGLFKGETPRFSYTPGTASRKTPGIVGTGSGGRREGVGLTPAGRRLFERVGTPRRDVGGGGLFGGGKTEGRRGLRTEWTPVVRKKD
ncbi:hypothetical protein GQ43DRAFT_445026 [Delitschia confertaspora ATCC 74209]|uniref:Nuclear protein DGCR14 n=1 Tax=Delitschia confertaspora ATCC 74209 TaxID=1513339 RepID=A0A9P4JH00_9PLEO|nr:hypothetical protein GQ43DRAFT_445026 [Delitschia confertaspora ATCC 74209]